MSEDTINLNPDPLAEFTEILRTTGEWCDVVGEYKVTHYFISKNKSLDTAISLCGDRIKSIKDIRRTTPRNKCLVCDLFAVSRMEARKERLRQGNNNNAVKERKMKPKKLNLL